MQLSSAPMTLHLNIICFSPLKKPPSGNPLDFVFLFPKRLKSSVRSTLASLFVETHNINIARTSLSFFCTNALAKLFPFSLSLFCHHEAHGSIITINFHKLQLTGIAQCTPKVLSVTHTCSKNLPACNFPAHIKIKMYYFNIFSCSEKKPKKYFTCLGKSSTHEPKKEYFFLLY